jgi:elongin-A
LRSPQIIGEDAELWQAFIARDIPNWASKSYVPKNPFGWYDLYQRYKKEQNEDIARDEAVLRQNMMLAQKRKETTVSKIVDLRTLPKIPRDPKMRPNNGGVPIGKKGIFKKDTPSVLSWNVGSKTKLTDGKSVLTRARREAKEISQMSKLSKPTHRLAAIGKVTKAPAGMVNEYRKAAQPAIRILSRKFYPVGKDTGGISRPGLEDREKRLRAIQAGMIQNATLVSSPSEDDISADDLFDVKGADDFFDEKPKRKPASRIVAASSARPSPSRPVASSSFPSRPTPSTQQPQAQSYTSSSSSPTKPSDLISSLINQRKPLPRPAGSSRPFNSSPGPALSKSPSPNPGERRQPPVIMKRKLEVDIFNRGSKKVRR